MGRRPQGSQGQNRTGESPPSGIAGGPAETWTMVELGTHLAYRKSESWKLSTYSRARRRSIPTGGRELRMDVPGSKYVAGFVAEHDEAALLSRTHILEVSNNEQPTEDS